MADIRLQLDPDRMTWGDLIALDEWTDLSERARRDALARFLVDAHDEPLDEEEARATLGALPLTQIAQVKDALGDAIRRFREGTVPSPSSGS